MQTKIPLIPFLEITNFPAAPFAIAQWQNAHSKYLKLKPIYALAHNRNSKLEIVAFAKTVELISGLLPNYEGTYIVKIMPPPWLQ